MDGTLMSKLTMDGNRTNITCTVVDADTVECGGEEFYKQEFLSSTEGLFWAYLGIYVALVLFAGLMSGLTMGLLSLDKVSLEVLCRGGKPREQKYAKRILMLVRRHHLLLVTLLLSNAAAVEAMPIFLEKITNEVVAIVVSVTAVLLFGEIIPQALCTRFGLAIGYYCSPIVMLLLALFYPISFPIAMLLDCVLGKDHGTFFRRAELRELVKLHGSKSHENEEPLTYDEVLIVKSALEMRDKTVADAMTPLESVFMLNIKSVIDRTTINELLHQGHSRVPVFEGTHSNVVGMLLVKRLIKLDPDDCTPVRTLEGAYTPPPSCLTTLPLYDLLNIFQTGRSHLSIVYQQETDSSEPELVGIITLEDVIEELIGEEIIDETDLYVDIHHRVAVARARLQYHRQSISVPSSTPAERRHQRLMHRSKSMVARPSGMMLPHFLRRTSQVPVTVHPEEHTMSASVPTERAPHLETISEGGDSVSPQERGLHLQIDERTPLLLRPS